MAYARLGLLALLLLWLPLPASAVTLKIATLSPDGTSWMRAMRAAGDEIAKRSGGRVGLRFYPGGVMGSDQSVMRKIRVGQLQGGAVTIGALSGVDKDVQVYGIPFLFRDLGEVDYVRRQMDSGLLQHLERSGFVGFGFAEGGFAYLMSREPVRTVDDLKGRKVWAPEGDTISLTAFESIGVTPTVLPVTDVLTALQTGLIDTVASPAVGAIALQWHTRVKYLTDVPLLYTYGILVISDKAFGKLSAKDQALVREVLGRTFEQIDRQNRKDNAGALRALTGQGIKRIEPPSRDLERWRQTVDTAQQRLANRGFFSREVVNRVRKLLANYRAGKR
jgi:TRAP-type C4-dicarboxylate transport system substrate-binding protein